MRIVVATCAAYSDCWTPFFVLFHKFWPKCPYHIIVITDACPDRSLIPSNVQVLPYAGNWCERLVAFLKDNPEEITLLFQEDFLIAAPVRLPLIKEALQHMGSPAIGAARLYPCPGAASGPGNFGVIERHEPYRTSLQASLWTPDYLRTIAEHSPGGGPSDFEIQGGRHASEFLPQEVMAFRRDVQPRPIEYLCTAIVKGRWLPEAKTLCEAHDIEMNWSRDFADLSNSTTTNSQGDTVHAR